MSTNTKNSIAGYYYSGGLAEIVSSPSTLTCSFFADWFTGRGSLGKAMKLLQLPYQVVDLHLLDLVDNELVVNLSNEEQTLYHKTIFRYKNQTDIHSTPALVVDLAKLINPICLLNTIRIVLTQSKWIANPQATTVTAQNLVDSIPNEKVGTSIEEIDELLKDEVWPNVIAIGLMSEFYNQLLLKEAKESPTEINKHISAAIADKDWFFRSIADQAQVKSDNMSFAEYIKTYGLRADKDYELTSPRWYEIQEKVKMRIESISDRRGDQSMDLYAHHNLQNILSTSVKLQLLRSESKRKALIHMNNLREAILRATKGLAEIGHITKAQLLSGELPRESHTGKIEKHTVVLDSSTKYSGKGISISQGDVTGLAKNILDNDMDIPKGTIGIFPNASPEFAVQYPKCEGMIFLKGGQTSHGAIVAREFKIPAIVDSKVKGIADSSTIKMSGTTGEWHIL